MGPILVDVDVSSCFSSGILALVSIEVPEFLKESKWIIFFLVTKVNACIKGKKEYDYLDN